MHTKMMMFRILSIIPLAMELYSQAWAEKLPTLREQFPWSTGTLPVLI
jgi:hypothetical protein